MVVTLSSGNWLHPYVEPLEPASTSVDEEAPTAAEPFDLLRRDAAGAADVGSTYDATRWARANRVDDIGRRRRSAANGRVHRWGKKGRTRPDAV